MSNDIRAAIIARKLCNDKHGSFALAKEDFSIYFHQVNNALYENENLRLVFKCDGCFLDHLCKVQTINLDSYSSKYTCLECCDKIEQAS